MAACATPDDATLAAAAEGDDAPAETIFAAATEGSDDKAGDVDDVNGDGSVVKEILVPGSGPTCEDGFTVGVNYVGTLPEADGIEFDRNHGGYPFAFKIGEGAVIVGWEDALKHMRMGEKARVTVQASHGYGG